MAMGDDKPLSLDASMIASTWPTSRRSTHPPRPTRPEKVEDGGRLREANFAFGNTALKRLNYVCPNFFRSILLMTTGL
uniref:Uncharacterized protein n=1 Tax=Oryza brachyantha TaxID=4533 RepID=J3LWY2_ORYBR